MDVLNTIGTYAPFLAAMAFAGVLGGLVAGLLGVGGGIVIVPVLYSVLVATGVADNVAIKVAVATSLATIVVTSLSSARSHYLRGAVDLALLRAWLPAVVVGVLAGTAIATLARGWVLTLVFAVIALLVAINMFVRGRGSALWPDFPNPVIKSAWGVFVGLISAMMGIGGGTLSVPILTAYGFDIRRAVGTAAAIGFLIAVPGTLGYVAGGWSAPGLPPFSLGYVNVIGFVALVPLTSLFAPVGAYVTHSIPPRALSNAFAVFLLLTSARMFWSLLP